jgi:hypothetical protein
MSVTANCELSPKDEHDVMYAGFDSAEEGWGFYERVRIRRDVSESVCLKGNSCAECQPWFAGVIVLFLAELSEVF